MKFSRFWIRRSIALQIFFIVLMSPALKAADEEIPDTISGTKTINAEELIDLATETESLILIDARLRSDHKQGFIEGSINLPNTLTSCASLKEFTNDESQPLLFYCNGPKCERSTHAVQIAQSCGYQNIYWFRGGMDEWKKKHYPYIKR